MDAINHSRETGCHWAHQYAIDCGWDHESIRLTAEIGASDHDREALGEAADELEAWCRKRVAA